MFVCNSCGAMASGEILEEIMLHLCIACLDTDARETYADDPDDGGNLAEQIRGDLDVFWRLELDASIPT
jgi:hypothetical protein